MPNRGGRPKKPIDGKRVIYLASRGLTTDEIAALEDCSDRTLQKRFFAQLEKGRSICNASLRSKQVEKALGLTTTGDTTMLIWLGKNRLGQSDKHEIDTNWPETLGYGGLDIPRRATELGETDKPN